MWNTGADKRNLKERLLVFETSKGNVTEGFEKRMLSEGNEWEILHKGAAKSNAENTTTVWIYLVELCLLCCTV